MARSKKTASEKLKQWRYEADLTQEEAASTLDVNARTYQRWERGEGSPSGRLAARVERRAGVEALSW